MEKNKKIGTMMIQPLNDTDIKDLIETCKLHVRADWARGNSRIKEQLYDIIPTTVAQAIRTYNPLIKKQTLRQWTVWIMRQNCGHFLLGTKGRGEQSQADKERNCGVTNLPVVLRHNAVCTLTDPLIKNFPGYFSVAPEGLVDWKTTVIHKLVHSLPDRHRAGIVLYYLEDKSQKEIADIWHCTPSYVGIVIRQGTSMLKSQLEIYNRSIPLKELQINRSLSA